jgi:hypothetical protein
MSLFKIITVIITYFYVCHTYYPFLTVVFNDVSYCLGTKKTLMFEKCN